MKKILFIILTIIFATSLTWSSSASTADTLLNGKWNIQKVNGNDVVKEKAGREMPYLEFHPSSSNSDASTMIVYEVSGNTGCNTLSGKITINGDEVTFMEMSTTKMECTDAKYEQDIDDIVFTKTALKYKVDNGTLYLIKDGKEVMVLTK